MSHTLNKEVEDKNFRFIGTRMKPNENLDENITINAKKAHAKNNPNASEYIQLKVFSYWFELL